MKFAIRVFLGCALVFAQAAWADDLPTVHIVKIERRALFDSFLYPVILESQKESEIYAEIDGVVKDSKVTIGQSVKADQVLMMLRQNSPDYAYAPFAVKSPIEGKIAAVQKKIGGRVQKGDLLVHIVNDEDLVMKFAIPEGELTVLKAGIPGEIRFRAIDANLPIIVSGISPLVSPATGTADGELAWGPALPPATAAAIRKHLFPGMVGRVTFHVNRRNGIAIPKDALVFEKKTYFVRLLVDGKSLKREVTIGKTLGETIEILTGLNAGDTLITQRSKYLKDGEAVTIQKDDGV